MVYFSLDGGLTIDDSDHVAPYSYTATLATTESIHVWGRAYNSVSGCYGTWDNTALAISHPLPVTEKIESSHSGVQVPGYVDVVCPGQQNVLYYVQGEAGATYEWKFPQLGIPPVEDTTGVEIDWNVPGGDYSIEVQKISSFGCMGEVRDTLVLVDQPRPDLGGDVTLCEGNSHTFGLTENYESYEWNDFSTGPILNVSVQGKVYVNVWDEFGCSGSDTAMLVISSRPVVNLGKDTIVCGDNPLQLNAGDFATYLWSTGETVNPITVHEGAGTVGVTVTNEAGCEGSDEIVIGTCNPEVLLGVIPNTFTPNNDQIHDTWEIKKIYMFPDASIQIYDRWGRIVYKTDGGYDNNWHGTDLNGHDLPVDTYFYIIDLKMKGYVPITGNVTIIR
jgi:gliding motility-associated-like protein